MTLRVPTKDSNSSKKQQTNKQKQLPADMDCAHPSKVKWCAR